MDQGDGAQKRNKTRCRLYGELALAQRVLRDFAGAALDRIRVDSRLTYELLLEFTSEYMPEMTAKLEHYSGKQPIFDLYDVENEIQRSLDRKVELKSGGYLIIDQTEAMTTIDINTGAFVGHRNWTKPSSIPILKRRRRSPGSCVCAIWAALSLSTLSI